MILREFSICSSVRNSGSIKKTFCNNVFARSSWSLPSAWKIIVTFTFGIYLSDNFTSKLRAARCNFFTWFRCSSIRNTWSTNIAKTLHDNVFGSVCCRGTNKDLMKFNLKNPILIHL